ncbi:MAG TPA: hypothetical protein VFC07_04150 [Verrucomicrobiae bacterium]|nr:hypothetical protein [Verrucomicrobiae bacterium]
MKAKSILLAAVVGILTISAVQAQNFWSDHFVYEPGMGVYHANEFSMDVFGFHASHDRNGSSNGSWGPGVGGNYFFTDCIGVGIDTYSDAFNKPYQLNANAIFRYPIETIGLAPYGVAGFGRQWSYAPQWQGDVGVGVEYRFAAKTGVFTDLRGVFPGQTSNYVTWRFGFRVVF